MDAARARYYGTLGTFRYVWLHLPTGDHGESTLEDMDRAGALERINLYNACHETYRCYLTL